MWFHIGGQPTTVQFALFVFDSWRRLHRNTPRGALERRVQKIIDQLNGNVSKEHTGRACFLWAPSLTRGRLLGEHRSPGVGGHTYADLQVTVAAGDGQYSV